MSTALLVTGGRGQLGADLVAAAARAGIAEVRPPGSAELDVTDPAAVRAAVRALAGAGGSAVVVNAAAYTAVDAAECDPERAHAVNATGPAHLGDAGAGGGGHQVGPELPAPTGDQQRGAHAGVAAGDLSGSHHSRFSAYQRTVAASPSSKPTAGA